MSWQEDLERAHTELERSQQALREVQADLAGRTVVVKSKNRAVSVIVDAHGEVLDVKFHSRAYRSMSAAELGALLVETIGQARKQAMAELASRFSAVLPPAMPIADMLTGTADFDEMMREISRQVSTDLGKPSAERG